MFRESKPYTAVTVQIDRLTSEQYEENDLGGIFDLVEVIRLQGSGPTEAARALRKKLKYGRVHQQLRALTILDGLIQNGDSRFQRAFADEPLLDRLRILARDDMVDPQVKAKSNILFRQWAHAYRNTPGLDGIASLYKQLPNRKAPQPYRSRVTRETEADAEEDAREGNDPFAGNLSPSTDRGPSRPANSLASHTSSSSRPVTLSSAPDVYGSRNTHKDKKAKGKPFNLEKEKPKLLETIASASVASNNLLNALQLINREQKRVSEDPEVMKHLETCKVLRRQILRYIQLVESDQWIGSLLSANDELVKAVMAYDIMDKSISDDSDSELERGKYASSSQAMSAGQRGVEEALSTLNLSKAPPPAKTSRPAGIAIPPRPPVPPASGKQRMEDSEGESEEEEFEDNDPFGDQNAVRDAHVEKSGITWRDV